MQKSGYLAFVPGPLPVHLAYDDETIRLLSEADLALGRLSGISALLPNPDLFVAMYVKKEAVLSSQIEGIQCTLDDVLQYENDAEGVRTKAVGEVVNYVDAMNYGIARLDTLPLSLRIIREIHGHLLDGSPSLQVNSGDRRTGSGRRAARSPARPTFLLPCRR